VPDPAVPEPGAPAPATPEPAVPEVVAGTETPAAEPVAAQPAPAAGKQPSLVEQVTEAVKDAVASVEKHPQAGKVVKAVKDAREDLESGEVQRRVQKAVQDASAAAAAQVEQNQLVRLVHRALLAGVGAVALAQDEMEDLVNRLVERGEIAEADGKRMLKDVLEQRRETVERVQKTASEYIDHPSRVVDDAEKRIEAVMAKMNIPTKEEIEALSAKITALTRKVDELKKGS